MVTSRLAGFVLLSFFFSKIIFRTHFPITFLSLSTYYPKYATVTFFWITFKKTSSIWFILVFSCIIILLLNFSPFLCNTQKGNKYNALNLFCSATKRCLFLLFALDVEFSSQDVFTLLSYGLGHVFRFSLYCNIFFFDLYSFLWNVAWTVQVEWKCWQLRDSRQSWNSFGWCWQAHLLCSIE